MHRRPAAGTATGLALCGLLIAALSACAAEPPRPQPSASSSAAPIVPPAEPLTSFNATRSVDENLALFAGLADQTLAAIPTPRDFVNTLVGSGADPIAIQFGRDETTEGKTADATFWALRIGEKCLVGEYHPLEQDPEKPKVFTAATSPVGTGCLLGTPQSLQ